jgi:hypothetical protein
MSLRTSPRNRDDWPLGLWVFVPLALNALLYLAYRDWSLWCFRWVEWTGGEGPVTALRGLVRGLPTPPDWVRYSLASGLWIFGVVSFLCLVWSREGHPAPRSLRAWITGVLLLCLGSEALQALSLIPGTADWNDVAAYSIGAALALWRAQAGRPLKSKGILSRPQSCSALLVLFALLLATGAIYEGAMTELVAHVGLYR